MKSLISEEVINKLNKLVQRFFQMNAIFDNMAYSLENQGYHAVSDIFHHSIAHKPPVWSDKITDFGYNLGIRFVREGLSTENRKYNGVEEIFNEVYNQFINITDEVARLIEELDFDYKNRYIVINLEDLLQILQPYVRVADTWKEKAHEYTKHDNLYKFDKDFHTFISIPEQ